MQVLRSLPASEHPDLLVGTNHYDDAGVFRIDDTTALVQTVDFFPPLVDDPYEFGRIAAANALSDIYVMGGEPLTALSIVGFPDEELPIEILGEILRGGHERVTAAGAVIVGGHSVRDAEIKYGLAVTGKIAPDRIITNGGAKPGDRLVLTKPIGSGVITSAAKKGKIDDDELAAVIAVMTQLNRGGRDAMVAVGVSAATDISGFGLVGHAFEIADASDVTVEIETACVPLLPRTLEFAGNGFLTRAYKSTIGHLGDRLQASGAESTLVNVLCDAQTSGGLLICVPEERLEKLVTALNENGALCAAEIGTVRKRGDFAMVLV